MNNLIKSLRGIMLNGLKKQWGGPIILKGIIDVEDAKEALNIGADGIIVSNHGGRQLDGTVSSILFREDSR